jgi:lipoprotein-anchoring transpeptidase ErfK/SrfK
VLAPLALILIPRLGNAQKPSSGKADTLTSATEVEALLTRLKNDIDKLERETPVYFRSPADSLDWERARREAARAKDFRIEVSLFHRRVWVIIGADTLLKASAAVASGMTLDYAGRSWTFRTPRGRHAVQRKVTDPVWTPPDWLYAEVASEHQLKLQRLTSGHDVRLQDSTVLTVRGKLVGVIRPGSSEFEALPIDEHIVFDGTLFIPPYGTENRRIEGELGSYALDLGEGYMIHGTPHEKSIGRAITHGCIRLSDDDIKWLYDFIPDGTPVYIY